jgi:hypothetical protein
LHPHQRFTFNDVDDLITMVCFLEAGVSPWLNRHHSRLGL